MIVADFRIINTRLCDDKLVRISAGKDCCGRS